MCYFDLADEECLQIIIKREEINLKAVIKLKKKTVSIKKTLLHLTILMGFVGSSFFVIDLGHFSLFPYRILWIILLFFFLLDALIKQRKVSFNCIKIKHYICFLMLWLYYAVLSLGWAASPVEAVKEIISLFMGISIILFVIFYFTDIKDLKLFYNSWLLALVTSIGIGIWNYFTGQTLNPDWIVIEQLDGTISPTSFYAFPNIFAVFLSLGTPFILTFTRYHNKPIMKLLGVGVLLLSLYLMWATDTRSGYLAVFSSLTFWFLFMQKSKSKFKTMALVGLGILLLFAFFPEFVQNVIKVTRGELESLVIEWGTPDTSMYWRTNMIKNGLHFLINSWGFGVGAGNTEHYMSYFYIYDTGGNPYMHNLMAQILTNYGIFIFGCYIVFYINLVVNLYRVHSKLVVNVEKMICEALLLGLVGLFFTGFSTGTIMGFAPKWIFFAFVLSFLNYYRNKMESSESCAENARRELNVGTQRNYI